jgi:hypothetical protein
VSMIYTFYHVLTYTVIISEDVIKGVNHEHDDSIGEDVIKDVNHGHDDSISEDVIKGVNHGHDDNISHRVHDLHL